MYVDNCCTPLQSVRVAVDRASFRQSDAESIRFLTLLTGTQASGVVDDLDAPGLETAFAVFARTGSTPAMHAGSGAGTWPS
jgi:hypothetical protein